MTTPTTANQPPQKAALSGSNLIAVAAVIAGCGLLGIAGIGLLFWALTIFVQLFGP